MQILPLHDSAQLSEVKARATDVLGDLVRDPALADARLILFESGYLADALSWLGRQTTVGLVLTAVLAREPLPVSSLSQLLAAGASDVFEVAPAEAQSNLGAVRVALGQHAAVEKAVLLGRRRPDLVGQSPAWLRALREVAVAGLSRASAVLLRGETGTGKEGIARWLHDLWAAERPWVAVDCAASVDSLWASELFGHRKGAFTGAIQDRDGMLARAHGGTLFLDEVGELRPAMQSALLRVLQERAYTPVGGSAPRAVEFRVVSATSRDLEAMVQEGTFRRDLFERLAGAVCCLPPLRERTGDGLILLRHFLRQLGRDKVELDPRVVDWIGHLALEGNVRQLKSLAVAIVARLGSEPAIRIPHIPRSCLAPVPERSCAEEWNGRPFRESFQRAARAGVQLSVALEAVRDEMVRAAVEQSGGVSAQAAAKIGVSERMIQLRRRAWMRTCESGPALEPISEELAEGSDARMRAS